MPRAILDGARFGSGEQAMAYARERVIDAFEARGSICQITHSQDGTHKNGSPHYINHAEEYGFVGVPEEDRQAIYEDTSIALAAHDYLADFKVLYQNGKQHMYVEWKPKRAMNR